MKLLLLPDGPSFALPALSVSKIRSPQRDLHCQVALTYRSMIPRSVDLPIQQTLYELVLDMHGRRYRLAVENTVLSQLPLLVAHSSSAPSQYLTHADRVWHFW
jgi:hypothetical protein